ncbi:MAG: methylhydantoinase, partial [Thermoproteota archaeon]|nr:methylhydantoinase [Thermoproteota archaeon]
VQSEYISERSILRATAIGNITLDLTNNSSKEMDPEELTKIANDLFRSSGKVSLEHVIGNYYVFSSIYQQKKLLFKVKRNSILVLDKFGRVRLSLDSGKLINGHSKDISENLQSLLSDYSNADLSPQIHLIDGFQILDFSSLTANEQVVQAIREQLGKIRSNILLVIKI